MWSITVVAGLGLWGTVVAGSNEFGLKFLAENKEKPGVTTLASGLQYKVLNEGDGDEHPKVDTSCLCHYEGRTAGEHPEGKIFDSSYKRGQPSSFAPNQVIKGWTEAMQMMVQGDKWEMYIPSELGYGDGGSGADIKGGDVLVFTMEMVEINGPTVPAERGPPAQIELESMDSFTKWSSEGKGPKVVAVFKKPSATAPLISKLFTAFKVAARAAKKAGEDEYAYFVQSSFDGKTGKYVPSAIGEALAAPTDDHPDFKPMNIYTRGKSMKWRKCKTGAKSTTASTDNVKAAILKCAESAKGKKKKATNAKRAKEAEELAAAAAAAAAAKDEIDPPREEL